MINIICPKITTEGWKYAEKRLGSYDKALWLYDTLGMRDPSKAEVNTVVKYGMSEITAGNTQRVWDIEGIEENGILKFEDGKVKWSKDVNGKGVKAFRGYLKNGIDTKIRKLTEKYGEDNYQFNKVPFLNEKGQSRWRIAVVDLTYNNEYDARKLGETRKVALEREELDREANVRVTEEGDILPQDQFQKESQLTPVERDLVEKQKQILLKTLPFVENIIEDTDLLFAGKLEAGGKTIRINPLLMGKDTLGHEFGHLLIDLAGGMNNSLIKKGREQLVGTDLETQIKNKYPELVEQEDERIDKEILATAVGIEAAKLFDQEEKHAPWYNWLVRFFRRLRNLLGIDISVARQLAERLVYGEETASMKRSNVDEFRNSNLTAETSEYDQLQKVKEDITSVDKLLVELSKFRENAKISIAKKIKYYRSKKGNKATVEDLESFRKLLNRAKPTTALVQFTRNALETTKKIYEEYLFIKKRQLDSKENEKYKFTPEKLYEWRNFVIAYDSLDEIRDIILKFKDEALVLLKGDSETEQFLAKLARDNKSIFAAAYREWQEVTGKEAENMVQDKDVFDLLIPMLNDAINVKDKIKLAFKDQARELMVDLMMDILDTEIIGNAKDDAERAYNKKSKLEKSKISLEDFTIQYLADRRHEIDEDKKEFIEREMAKASKDVGYLTRWMDTLLNSSDVIGSVIAKIYSRQVHKSREEEIHIKHLFVERQRKLEAQLGRNIATDHRKFYDFMLEEFPENDIKAQIGTTGYLVSEIPSKLYSDFELKIEELKAYKIKGTGEKLSRTEIGRRLARWKEEAAPRNKDAYKTAQIEFFDGLLKEKVVTPKEYESFVNKVKKGDRNTTVRSILKNNDVAYNEYISWVEDNTWNYRDLSPAYQKINGKWDKLQEMRKRGLKNGVQTDERIIFYDFIVSQVREADSKLPTQYRRRFKLPSFLKTSMDRIREGQRGALRKALKIGVSKHSTDIERGQLSTEEGKEKTRTEYINEAGETVYFVPIHFTQNISPNDQSYDLGSVYYNYVKMATEYDYKNEFLAEAETLKFFANERDVTKRDSKGNKIYDAISNYDPSLEKKVATIKGDKANITAMIEDFMKMVVYGITKEEEPDITLLGMTFDRAKLLDGIGRYTSINLLGVNFVQGVANIAVGETLQTIDALAAEHYSLKDLSKASKFYFKDIGNVIADIGARVPKSFLGQLIDVFDTLNEYDNGRINRTSRFAELMRTDTAFFTAHIGEHFMQSRLLLAMLYKLQAKDIKGNNLGSMINFLSFDNEGNLIVHKKVKNFDKTQRADFAAKVKRVTAFIHGEYSNIGMNAMQKFSLGRMAIMFRKFIVPGVKRRFGKRQWNELLGSFTEGNYRTTGRYLTSPLKQVYYNFMKNLGKDIDKMKTELGSMRWDNLTKMEKANLIRTLGEVLSMVSLIILSRFFIKKVKEKDDDEEKLWAFLAYQTLRLQAELAFYVSPPQAFKILRSPAATMAIVEDVGKLVKQLLDPVLTGTFDLDVYERGPWKGHYKIEKTITHLLPIYKQVYRIRDIKDMLSWFNR